MYRLISGNTYILGNIASTKKIMELTLLRPDRVKIEVDSFNIPKNYIYEINGNKKSYRIDPVTFMSEILHVKEPHPLDDLYGFSPIAAAAMSIAQNNESSEWNKKLLENSGRPPGIISMKDKGDNAASPTPEEMTKISADIHEKFKKWSKDGRIPVLSFAMDWQSLGMTPTDMNWISGKSTTARDICLAFRYPPFLLGMPEGATYNNISEAKLALYEEAVIPVLQSILSELAYYISVQKGINLEIDLDLDQVPALMVRREIARKNARDDVGAGILSINEGREEGGYDPVDGGDEILVPAGKLPLNFDVGSIPPPKFYEYLIREGFSKEAAIDLTKLAYSKPAHECV
jgi:HK97 family phage portal protein